MNLQTRNHEMSDAPVVGATEASDEVHLTTGIGAFAMENSASELTRQQQSVCLSDQAGFQAVVFADYGWADGGHVSEDPIRLQSISIGIFSTFDAAKQACLQALRDVIDYIGFTIKAITNTAEQPLAA